MAENKSQSARVLAFPSDDKLKEMVGKAKADSKSSATTGVVCLLVLVRMLAELKADFANDAERQAVLEWLLLKAHGLGCNASQFGQWAGGDAAKGNKKEDLLKSLKV